MAGHSGSSLGGNKGYSAVETARFLLSNLSDSKARVMIRFFLGLTQCLDATMILLDWTTVSD